MTGVGGQAITEFGTAFGAAPVGEELFGLVADLYPLCRSITGDGLRATLETIGAHVPLERREVPTGTPVLDWTVPKEWNVREAYIANVRGERIVDLQKSNLHVLGYSVPVRGKFTLEELREHLYTLPEHPEWVPWRTSYYQERWGFCLSHRQLGELVDDEYEVCLDSSLEDGHLTVGEYYIPGRRTDEVLITCHTCHPSLANDNLSGIAVATLLAKSLSRLRLMYSYRFLFAPVTIGAITWLALNEPRVAQIKHGLALACLGDSGQSTYKKSRRGDAEIDRAMAHVLRHSGTEHQILEFSPYGYDERQFCSPGFNLPMGCLMRTPYGCFPEYHTSADDLTFVKDHRLADSFAKVWSALYVLEHNARYRNRYPKGEPQLGRRGLYRSLGGLSSAGNEELAMLWVLNLSDGNHTLLDIAERAGLWFGEVARAAARLLAHELLDEVDSTPAGPED